VVKSSWIGARGVIFTNCRGNWQKSNRRRGSERCGLPGGCVGFQIKKLINWKSLRKAFPKRNVCKAKKAEPTAVTNQMEREKMTGSPGAVK